MFRSKKKQKSENIDFDISSNSTDELEKTLKIDQVNLISTSRPSSSDAFYSSPSSSGHEKTLGSIITDTYHTIITGFSNTRIIDWQDELDGEEEQEPVNTYTSDTEAAKINNIDRLEKNINILEELSISGLGRIDKGYDKKFSRTVAVKSLRDELKNRLDRRKAFISEAKVTAQLDHPAIIPVYALYEDQDSGLHLAMKMVRGRNLKEYLSKTCMVYKQLSRSQRYKYENVLLWKRLNIFLRVCDAVAYVHHRKVLHGDLNPENIMIGSFNETYVLDWGVADYLVDGDNYFSQRSGSLQYIAPEVINKQPIDNRSDIYLLGLILYELVFLKPALPPTVHKGEAVRKARTCQFESFDHLFKCKVDIDLKMIISKALALSPQNRYNNVKELERDIRNFEIGEEVIANPDGWFDKIIRRVRYHYKLLMFFTIFLVLLLTSISSFSLYREFHNRSFAMKHDTAMVKIYSNGLYSCSVFDQLFKDFEYQITALARETALLLSGEIRPGDHKIYTFQDGTKDETAPPDFIFSPVYDKKISLDHSIYILPEPKNKTQSPTVEKDMRLLYPLRENLRNALVGSLLRIIPKNTPDVEINNIIRNKVKPPLMVVYVGLSNGLAVGYPYELDYTDTYDPRARGWYHDAMKAPHRAVWGAPYIDVGGVKEIIITCSKVIFNERRQIIGVAAGDFSLTKLVSMLEEIGNIGSYIKNKYLLDEEGRIIAENDLDLREIRDGDSLEFKKFHAMEHLPGMWKQKNGWFFTRENGVDYLYFYLEIKTLRWLYVERVDFNELMRSLD